MLRARPRSTRVPLLGFHTPSSPVRQASFVETLRVLLFPLCTCFRSIAVSEVSANPHVLKVPIASQVKEPWARTCFHFSQRGCCEIGHIPRHQSREILLPRIRSCERTLLQRNTPSEPSWMYEPPNRCPRTLQYRQLHETRYIHALPENACIKRAVSKKTTTISSVALLLVGKRCAHADGNATTNNSLCSEKPITGL